MASGQLYIEYYGYFRHIWVTLNDFLSTSESLIIISHINQPITGHSSCNVSAAFFDQIWKVKILHFPLFCDFKRKWNFTCHAISSENKDNYNQIVKWIPLIVSEIQNWPLLGYGVLITVTYKVWWINFKLSDTTVYTKLNMSSNKYYRNYTIYGMKRANFIIKLSYDNMWYDNIWYLSSGICRNCRIYFYHIQHTIFTSGGYWGR